MYKKEKTHFLFSELDKIIPLFSKPEVPAWSSESVRRNRMQKTVA